jgi:DNA replication protein DnaC
VEGARRLVVLDDLLGRDLSAHEASQIVYRLIDTVYTNGAACLITMNQDPRELTARFPPHELSRLLAGATHAPMTATKDWRRG